MKPNEGDVALACMLVLVDEFARAGVDTVCLSPGSRSTPLALALARHGGFAVRVHLDERAAAFFALGRAKATGIPAIVACTSGTATANYLPAVIEASQARVPMIVLTADRPPELHGVGANQTITQQDLYGSYPRLFVDARVPAATPGAARYWSSLGARAVAAASGSPAGPVHLNVPFREPLVPGGAPVALRAVQRQRPVAPPRVPPRPRAKEVGALRRLIEEHERGVIYAGGMSGRAPAICDLAEAAGWPLFAEPLSNIRTPGRALAAGIAVVGVEGWVAEHAPEVVLQFGAAPTTRAAQAFVARAARLVCIDPDGWPADPTGRAEVVRAEPDGIARAVADRVGVSRVTTWTDDWRDADVRARAALDDFLDQLTEPFEPKIARDLAARLPEGATLVIGNSTPVRDLDLAMAPRAGLRVLANRGASGIDGLVSTILGVASAGAPTFALIGDLTLLHDIGSLIWTRDVDASITVIDNGGGGIFDLLPTAGLDEHERLFVTPPQAALPLDERVTTTTIGRGRGLVLRTDLGLAVSEALRSSGCL